MSEHTKYEEWLPLYVSGELSGDRRREVERHLADCQQCRSDLALWQAISGELDAANRELAAPASLVEGALVRIRAQERHPVAIQPVARLQRAFLLLRAQVPLVRREIWPASAAVIATGYIAAFLFGDAGVIHTLAPLVAAASIAVIYGPENDAGIELALASPTSTRQVLLARLVLVFGYNLLLALVASLGLLPILPAGALASLILGWLAPMTFLSAAALVLSLWIGTANAAALAYFAWLAQAIFSAKVINSQAGPLVEVAIGWYLQFWNSPLLLLSLGGFLLAIALWLVGRQETNLPRWA